MEYNLVLASSNFKRHSRQGSYIHHGRIETNERLPRHALHGRLGRLVLIVMNTAENR